VSEYQDLVLYELALLTYRSQLSVEEDTIPRTFVRGQSQRLKITVRNIDNGGWFSRSEMGSVKSCVRLGILWYESADTMHPKGESRADLPTSMYPSDKMMIPVILNPVGYDGKPLVPGRYFIWIGLVQENVSWFYKKGDPVMKFSVVVR
jgi:hypothetical protein